MNKSCVNCKHYRADDYCVLFDDLVKPAENCGMWDGEKE